MTGGILNDDERKANLSFAWLAALASLSGYTCERGAQPDVSSVDAVVRTGRPPDGQIDVQLKATSVAGCKSRWPLFPVAQPGITTTCALRNVFARLFWRFSNCQPTLMTGTSGILNN